MKKLSFIIFCLIQNYTYSNFEGASCTRAMKPWIKKMSSDIVLDDKKGLGFSIKNGEMIQMHFIEQEFPYQIRSYEGNSEKKIDIYESNIKSENYVFDFKNNKHGKVKEKKEDKSYTHFKLEPMENLAISPYLLFFERVLSSRKNNSLTNFEQSSLESCFAALIASGSKEKPQINFLAGKFNLSDSNIKKISGEFKPVNKKAPLKKENSSLDQ